MSPRGIPVGGRPGHRHVSPHEAHRASGALLAALILFLVAIAARAESRQGTAAQVVRSVDLRKGPSDTSSSVGRLPKGTILSLTGEVKNGYVGVDVELEDGNVSGWVPRESLNRAARETLPDDSVQSLDDEDADEETAPRKRPRSDVPADGDEDEVFRPRTRVRVPEDEGLLMRREPSFFYGVQLGGGAAIIEAPDVTPDFFIGTAMTGGAHLGFHLSRSFPARLELNYTKRAGTSASVPDSIEVGFVDTVVSVGYLIDDFELFAGVQYSYAISVNNLPRPLNTSILAPSDLSSLFVQAGAGYRFFLTDVIDLVLRVRYDFSFLRAPVGFQTIQGLAFLQFRG